MSVKAASNIPTGTPRPAWRALFFAVMTLAFVSLQGYFVFFYPLRSLFSRLTVMQVCVVASFVTLSAFIFVGELHRRYAMLTGLPVLAVLYPAWSIALNPLFRGAGSILGVAFLTLNVAMEYMGLGYYQHRIAHFQGFAYYRFEW